MMQHLNIRHPRFGAGAGFTLVELLIVVAIIAGLAAIVIPLLSSAGDKTSFAADVANQSAIAQAVQNYAQLHNGSFPDEFDSLLNKNDTTQYYDKLSDIVCGRCNVGPLLVSYDLSQGGARGQQLRNAGIIYAVHHDPNADYPNDSTREVDRSELFDMDESIHDRIAILNTTDNGGSGVNTRVQRIYDHFKLDIDEDIVAVFGLGTRSTIVGDPTGGLHEAPYSTCAKPDEYYTRYLVLFKLSKMMYYTEKAQFIGVLDPRGRMMWENERDYRKPGSTDPHAGQ